MDFYDILGVSTILEWGREKLGIDKYQEKEEIKKYIPDEIKPIKFQYRPQTLAEFISQDKAKSLIELYINIILTKKPCHFLLSGNSGSGKSSLAYIIANRLNFPIYTYTGGSFSMDNLKDFILGNNKPNPAVLFLDELQGTSKEILEFMLPIIEDFRLPKGNLSIRPFVLVGATTEKFTLVKKCNPFVDRIACQIQLEDYTAVDIKRLLAQFNSQVYQISVSNEEYDILSTNVRYNPRIAISYFDLFASCHNVKKVLEVNRIVKDGLTDIDIKILRHLYSTNHPIGEETLSLVANIDRFDYKKIVEPYLIRQNLLSRARAGRILTDTGRKLLNELKVV